MTDRFAKLSANEKRLSMMVAALVVVAMVLFIGLRCKDALDLLDETIASQELALIDFAHYAALAGPVDEAYGAMAQQHSSEWTQEEIHDRLRTEIARLSLRDAPAASKPGELLVDIRSWPVGALDDSGEDYRTYQIKFRTEPAHINNLAQFLERLQQSPQALRVDYLELLRQPQSTVVTADLRVTRTVIGKGAAPAPPDAQPAAPVEPPRTGNLLTNAGFAEWDAQASSAPGWSANDATLSTEEELANGGGTALSVQAQGANAELYQVQDLRAGATYTVSFVARSSGAAHMRIVDESTGVALQGAAPLVAGPAAYRYRFQFTAPGTGDTPVAMRAPSIVIADSGGVLVIDDVVLEEAGG
ncbi:MAG: hypothetical protein FJY92_08925 [Candidatus Hydrogenedentes bacterium]|nr:hypothetical protein [Candidatus Hydrogenedentota bacterium]